MPREAKASVDHYDCRQRNTTRGQWRTHEDIERRRKKIDDAFGEWLAAVQVAVDKGLAAWRAARE